MTEFVSKSGAQVMIGLAPWKDAKELKNVIVSASVPLEKISFTEKSLDDFLSKFIVIIDSAPVFQAAIWPCLIRCTRNQQKIEQSTFDSIEARADYYEIVEACVKENLRPLLEKIFLPFIAQPGQKNEHAPESA